MHDPTAHALLLTSDLPMLQAVTASPAPEARSSLLPHICELAERRDWVPSPGGHRKMSMAGSGLKCTWTGEFLRSVYAVREGT